jgi:hypothetical protein
MPIPLRGDRAVRQTLDYPELHADDVESGSPTIHNPTPGVSGTAPVSDGTKYVATAIATACALATHEAAPDIHHARITLDTGACSVLGLSTQQLTLKAQAPNTYWGGPASGSAAASPTFRTITTWGAISEEPEWANTVIIAGSLHQGSLFPYSDETASRNAYSWSASEADQTVQLIWRWRVPDNFVALSGSLWLASYSDSASVVSSNTGAALESLVTSTGSELVSGSLIKASSWSETVYTVASAPVASGMRLTLRVTLHADAGETVYLGSLYLPYQYRI